VDFVNDIDFVAPLVRREVDLVAQLADVLDAVVGRAVNFNQVEEAALVEGDAVRAGVVGALGRVGMQAVERLGDEARGGRLAAPARPREQIGVRDAVAAQRVAQRLDDVLLSDDFFPELRAPLAV